MAGMNDVKNDNHGGKDTNSWDGLPLLAGGETETPCCPICDHQFSMGMDKLHHKIEFIQSLLAFARTIAQGITNGGMQCVMELSPSYKCVYCSKAFREV